MFISEVLNQRCILDLPGELFPKKKKMHPGVDPNHVWFGEKKSPGDSDLHLWLKFANLNYFFKTLWIYETVEMTARHC